MFPNIAPSEEDGEEKATEEGDDPLGTVSADDIDTGALRYSQLHHRGCEVFALAVVLLVGPRLGFSIASDLHGRDGAALLDAVLEYVDDSGRLAPIFTGGIISAKVRREEGLWGTSRGISTLGSSVQNTFRPSLLYRFVGPTYLGGHQKSLAGKLEHSRIHL